MALVEVALGVLIGGVILQDEHRLRDDANYINMGRSLQIRHAMGLGRGSPVNVRGHLQYNCRKRLHSRAMDISACNSFQLTSRSNIRSYLLSPFIII